MTEENKKSENNKYKSTAAQSSTKASLQRQGRPVRRNTADNSKGDNKMYELKTIAEKLTDAINEMQTGQHILVRADHRAGVATVLTTAIQAGRIKPDEAYLAEYIYSKDIPDYMSGNQILNQCRYYKL